MWFPPSSSVGGGSSMGSVTVGFGDDDDGDSFIELQIGSNSVVSVFDVGTVVWDGIVTL